MQDKENKLYIGNVELPHPFLLAPLAGITDSAFRRICKAQGAAMVYSEMVSAKGLYYSDKNTAPLLDYHEEEEPIAYQLFGSEPELMAWAVKKLANRGNALLDVNMGCPVPKVVKNGEGSALMKEPEKAADLIVAMVRAEKEAAAEAERAPKPITVKCRMGWDRSSVNGIDFALRMEEAGAAAIALHGRTRDQYYSGRADWEILSLAKERLSVPLIGSGDVFSGEDACTILEETGCDFVMVARGALGNPWIFRECLSLWHGDPESAKPSEEELRACIETHMDLVIQEKGEAHAVREMRKHVSWYVKGHFGAAEIRRKVNGAKSKEEVLNILDSMQLVGSLLLFTVKNKRTGSRQDIH